MEPDKTPQKYQPSQEALRDIRVSDEDPTQEGPPTIEAPQEVPFAGKMTVIDDTAHKDKVPVTLSGKKITELEMFNKSALEKEANESAYVILEMNRETGQQCLIALPNYHTPMFGAPVVKPVSEIAVQLAKEGKLKGTETPKQIADYLTEQGGNLFITGFGPGEHDEVVVTWHIDYDMDPFEDGDQCEDGIGGPERMLPWDVVSDQHINDVCWLYQQCAIDDGPITDPGIPVVHPIMKSFGDSWKDFQTFQEAADYAEACNVKVFTHGVADAQVPVWVTEKGDDSPCEKGGEEGWLVPWEEFTDSQKRCGVPDATFIYVQMSDDKCNPIFKDQKRSAGTPIFRQERDATGNRRYHSQALMFAMKEFAESYVKERGIEDYAYAILELSDVVIGAVPMDDIIKMAKEEQEERIERFEALRKAGSVVDSVEPEEAVAD